MTYREFHRWSIETPESFWAEQAKLIDWHRPFDRVLDYSRPPFARWVIGGETNLCYNAVDRHLADRADQKALIYISTEVDQERVYSYGELHAEVQRMAAVLQELGVGVGDRVLIYLPMIPEAIFAMLATVRLGAIHSVVFGGFAAQSLAVIKEAGLDPERVNPNGGAIALGHPLGCTGAKLTATIIRELKRRNGRYGLVTMCVGGGMGAAGIFENVN